MVARIVLALLLSAATGAAHSNIIVAGDDDARNGFISLLNDFSTGAPWSLAGGTLAYNSVGPHTHFEMAMSFFARDEAGAPEITLDVGRNLPGTFIGASSAAPANGIPRGHQWLDLADIQRLPASPTAAIPDAAILPLQSAKIIHEVGEIYASLAQFAGNDFDASHAAAIDFENEEMWGIGSRGRRLPGGELVQIDARTQEWRSNWSDIADPTVKQVIYTVGVTNGDFRLTSVRKGDIDAAYSYDGSDLDVQLLSVRVLRLPEPGSIALVATAICCALGASRRRLA